MTAKEFLNKNRKRQFDYEIISDEDIAKFMEDYLTHHLENQVKIEVSGGVVDCNDDRIQIIDYDNEEEEEEEGVDWNYKYKS